MIWFRALECSSLGDIDCCRVDPRNFVAPIPDKLGPTIPENCPSHSQKIGASPLLTSTPTVCTLVVEGRSDGSWPEAEYPSSSARPFGNKFPKTCGRSSRSSAHAPATLLMTTAEHVAAEGAATSDAPETTAPSSGGGGSTSWSRADFSKNVWCSSALSGCGSATLVMTPVRSAIASPRCSIPGVVRGRREVRRSLPGRVWGQIHPNIGVCLLPHA